VLRRTEQLRVLDDKELQLLHESSLRLLADPGMKIMVPGFLEALEAKGAKVDHESQVVTFPERLVEETLEKARQERETATRLPFSWHDNFDLSSRPAEVCASFGGACLYFYDYQHDCIRETTADDMLKMVRLGEALPDVKSVGNPLMYLREPDGSEVHPRMVALKGAALIAKNTRKPATAQVLSTQDLELIIEIGIVLKGSWEQYKKEPFLMSVKEPTSPFRLINQAGEVFLAMARKGLPCHVSPMPLMGLNVPVTPAAAIAVVNAEILALWTAIKAVNPDAPVQASVVSGAMDMRLGRASFAAPEAILIDLGMAQLYERRYQLVCDTGVSWIDARYPGTQAALERVFKLMSCAACGKINYPTGALAGNTVFSAEQTMIDLEMGQALNRFLDGMEVNEETLCLDLIREAGIGATFVDKDHTAMNFRKMVWLPGLLDRTAAACGGIDREKDILAEAHRRWNAILNETEPYQIEEDKAREIDKIVEKGEKILTRGNS